MTPETLTSIRELDSRFNDGFQVRLLWCSHTGRVWVSVLDTRSEDTFRVEVYEADRPLDVFHHPYAYAGQRGIATIPRPAASEADQALAA
ncbi:MAG TPA: hypothetical protein VKR21_18895 [Solirubrobacteraceae bacterium]|nr:hypothetical protein [Solirubrobacteraceae bacterium]